MVLPQRKLFFGGGNAVCVCLCVCSSIYVLVTHNKHMQVCKYISTLCICIFFTKPLTCSKEQTVYFGGIFIESTPKDI